MSGNKEKDKTQHSEDADRRLEALMEDLRRSEQEILGLTPPEEETESEEEFDPEADFLSDEESDYVDLDAELLDNTADKLKLDVDDILVDEESQEATQPAEESEALQEESLEEELESSMDETVAEEETTAAESSIEPQQEEEEAESVVELHPLSEAEALVQGRLDGLEVRVATLESTPLQVSTPSARGGAGGLGRLAGLLSVLALPLSGAALWFAFSSSSDRGGEMVAAEELQGIQSEIAALRNRLAKAEQQVSLGNEEARATLQEIQAIVAAMDDKLATAKELVPDAEQTISGGEGVAGTETGAGKSQSPSEVEQSSAGEAAPKTVVAPPPPARKAKEGDTTGKVFVKGWAVNLQSFYRREDAETLIKSYHKAGIDAEIREIPKGDSTWYRVRVMGFKSQKEAERFIQTLTVGQGRDEAWPSYYQGYIDK